MATTGGIIDLPEEFIVEEVVCEEELQKGDYQLRPIDVYRQKFVCISWMSRLETYLGNKIGKCNQVDKHVASAIESVAHLIMRSRL